MHIHVNLIVPSVFIINKRVLHFTINVFNNMIINDEMIYEMDHV